MLDSYYDELLPLALKCGMTPTQFWEDEPRLFYSFIKKNEMERDEMNYNAWLFGLYFYKAHSVSLFNAFSSKESIENTYFEKPLEELNSNYQPMTKSEKEEKVKTGYRGQVNYWAKFGKKGVCKK